MNQKSTVTEHFIAASSIHLDDVLEFVDQLHTAASEGNSHTFTGMSELEVISYLRDLIYVTEEALYEIEQARAQHRKQQPMRPVLRLVEKIDKAG